MDFKKLLIAVAILSCIGEAAAQSAIVRGQISAGVYENVLTDGSGSLKVNISSQAAISGVSFTNTTPTITNATTVAITVNAARKYLSIQNNDAAGNLFCTPTAAATLTNGIKILPAQTWAPSIPPTNAINCIGSIASNANVIVTEGQ